MNSQWTSFATSSHLHPGMYPVPGNLKCKWSFDEQRLQVPTVNICPQPQAHTYIKVSTKQFKMQITVKMTSSCRYKWSAVILSHEHTPMPRYAPKNLNCKQSDDQVALIAGCHGSPSSPSALSGSLRGGVMVLEGAGVLARGTGFCT